MFRSPPLLYPPSHLRHPLFSAYSHICGIADEKWKVLQALSHVRRWLLVLTSLDRYKVLNVHTIRRLLDTVPYIGRDTVGQRRNWCFEGDSDLRLSFRHRSRRRRDGKNVTVWILHLRKVFWDHSSLKMKYREPCLGYRYSVVGRLTGWLANTCSRKRCPK